MRMIAYDIGEPVLTPEQREKLAAFFADATEENRRKAIFWIEKGLRLRKAYQEDRPNPKSAARQIARIKNLMDSLFDELTGLSPDTLDALHIAGQRHAENGGDFSEWKLASDLHGTSELLRQVMILRHLSGMALEDLPDPARRTSNAAPEKALAGCLVEAFAQAFGRLPRAKSGNTDSELSPIYKIIGAWYSHHDFKEAKQAIENNRDFY